MVYRIPTSWIKDHSGNTGKHCAFAAIIISNVIFGKLFTNFAAKLFAVVIGAVLYYIVIQVVLWLGLNTNDLKLLTALVVAIFLATPHWRAKLMAKKKQKGGV